MANEVRRSSLQELWIPEEELQEEDSCSSLESSIRSVNWVIANRGGFALLTGLVMVPSQFMGPKAARSNEIIDQAQSNEFRLDRFSLPIPGTNTSVEGVIYYPRGCEVQNCILYHNPNGITVAGYFHQTGLSYTPGEIVEQAKCPIILYDYRGTGLSSENHISSIAFKPTYESVVVDGEAVLGLALRQFKNVKVFGSSLGGGVATVSLERHLKKNEADQARVSLWNHDSFSTTPKVVLPGWPRVANWTGWAFGGLIDAETAMKSLIDRKIPITILCHTKDPVIPAGARMAEFVERLSNKGHVKFIYSPCYGHANLTYDMINRLSSLSGDGRRRVERLR